MKKLGFGFMRLPKINNENDNIDLQAVEEMVDLFIDRGFTYFDTAWFYHGGMSENAIKETLVKRYDRDEYILADKMPIIELDPQGKDEEEMREELEYYFSSQLERTGAGYFDYYLLHSLDENKFNIAKEYKAYEFLIEKKDQGLIKNIGFSFHDTVDVLEDIFQAYPEFSFVQLQINYLDWDHETIQSKKIYQLAREYGMDIIIMEPLKGGILARLSEEGEALMKDYNPNMSIASWAIRFASGLEGVFMVLSGMSNLDQIDDNTSYMKDFQPLNNEEMDIIKEVYRIIDESSMIECTECEYCLNDCPADIPIPSYFAYYNRDNQGLGGNNKERYIRTMENNSKPSDCIECGNCETICPQHLEIIDLLKDVDQYFMN